MNVLSANTISADDFARCQHRTPSGRRCQSTTTAPNASLCYTHAQSQQKAKEVGDLSSALLQNYQNFQTAQGVNFALANIYRLLAANRISARRASVLAYINSLLLRTLPAIDADFENGITDPTAPKKHETESPSSLTNNATAGTTTAAPSHPCTNAAQVWDSPNEPDPTKKPS